MESLNTWQFDVTPNTAVVTTKYVTYDSAPILLVTHEYDDEEGSVWQFHCGNGDYHSSVLQLVRLDEILKIDPTVRHVATLPIGFAAKRADKSGHWEVSKIDA